MELKLKQSHALSPHHSPFTTADAWAEKVLCPSTAQGNKHDITDSENVKDDGTIGLQEVKEVKFQFFRDN